MGLAVAIKCPKCHSENPETKQFCADCGTQLPPLKGIEVSVTRTLETTPDELARGSLFAGRYEIIEELGRGGMGRVFRAFDKKIDEEVALKLLKPEIAADNKIVARFRNELKVARKITHRNVCRMHDLQEEGKTLFISMEYVRGEDLKSLIRRTEKLTFGKAISIARQVAEGLAEAHKLGIIHRDLKPHNIMIDQEGNAKIMDFGIARSLQGAGTTAEGVIIGTPEYMSPEQVDGRPADARADIYALGVILFEMVTGRVPFEGETPFSIANKHKTEPPPDPRKLNPQIPEGLSLFILRCLEKERGKRFQTTEALLADLAAVEATLPSADRAAAGRPFTRRKPTPSKKFTVEFTRRKLIIPALAVVSVIAAAIIFWPKKASNLDPKLIAVAVFENKTGDPKLDPIGNMAAERIMEGLTQIGQFSVAPMPSAEPLAAESKNKDKLRALADLTKAAKIVHGDFYLQGDKLQFHAWVMDMAAKKNILALEPSSGPVNDPAAALEPLRLRLMGGLAAVFDPAVTIGFISFVKTPPDIEALREYVEGCKLYMRADYPKAAEHLLRAAERDPNFKSALIQAAWSYYWQGKYAEMEALIQKLEKSRADLSVGERYCFDACVAFINGDNEGHLRSMRQLVSIQGGQNFSWQTAWAAWHFNFPQEAIDRLADYDPNNKESLDWTKYYWMVLTGSHHMLGNFKRELKEARRGRKQFPELLSILSYECRALAALGRTKELQKLFEESKTLPPQGGYSPGLIMLSAGRELRVHGYKEEATRVLNQALQWFEARPREEKASNRYRQASTLYVLGKWTEAKELFEGLHSDVPDNITFLGCIGATEAQAGDKEEALKISKQLEENKKPYSKGTPPYWRARIAALLGDKERAVTLLRQATKQGFTYPDIHPTEDFESLADFPPYIQLMKPKG
jgi:serine/threonine protein kinase/tetratricopeptide (TPR) repeat protein